MLGLYLLIALVLFSSAVTYIDARTFNEIYKLLPRMRFESSQTVVNSNLLIYGYIVEDEEKWKHLVGEFDKEFHIFTWYYPSNFFRIKFYSLAFNNVFTYFSPYYIYIRFKYIWWAQKHILENFKDIYIKETNEVL